MSAARSLSLCFAAGAVGALANSLAVWLFGDLGLNQLLGVRIAPAWTASWLYPRIVWGGLFGLLLVLPFRSGWVKRGLLVSLAPSAAQLLYFFPAHGRGWLGLELGALTPVCVVLFNAIWGVVASWWERGTSG